MNDNRFREESAIELPFGLQKFTDRLRDGMRPAADFIITNLIWIVIILFGSLYLMEYAGVIGKKKTNGTWSSISDLSFSISLIQFFSTFIESKAATKKQEDEPKKANEAEANGAEKEKPKSGGGGSKGGKGGGKGGKGGKNQKKSKQEDVLKKDEAEAMGEQEKRKPTGPPRGCLGKTLYYSD